ncbi:MAG: beta-ketoacyl synthase N-terminal-like domain-containing protein, partial [Verrucomicrobiota bacterium]
MTIIEAFRRLTFKRGDKILIQTATGGTGLIAVQLAQHYGLDIIATAGSAAKLDYLRGLGVSQVINYREEDFEREVLRMTGGKGVSMVINTLSGENMQKGMNCLDKRGQYVELSMTAMKQAREVDLSHFTNNQTFIGLDLRRLIEADPGYVRDLWEACKEWMESGVLRSVISAELPFWDYRRAYRMLEERGNIGKVVVRLEEAPGEASFKEETVFKGVLEREETERIDIAIVGMSGAYGSAANLDVWWEALRWGRSLIGEVPQDRWAVADHYSEEKGTRGKTYSKWGSFLEGTDEFDPLFFRISGREAEHMDPQQRVFLQHCWHALEDAGMTTKDLDGKRCGVYVGAAQGDYLQQQTEVEDASAFWGNSSSILAARISYYLNLKGPALAVDTACSSSL